MSDHHIVIAIEDSYVMRTTDLRPSREAAAASGAGAFIGPLKKNKEIGYSVVLFSNDWKLVDEEWEHTELSAARITDMIEDRRTGTGTGHVSASLWSVLDLEKVNGKADGLLIISSGMRDQVPPVDEVEDLAVRGIHASVCYLGSGERDLRFFSALTEVTGGELIIPKTTTEMKRKLRELAENLDERFFAPVIETIDAGCETPVKKEAEERKEAGAKAGAKGEQKEAPDKEEPPKDGEKKEPDADSEAVITIPKDECPEPEEDDESLMGRIRTLKEKIW